MLESSGTVWPKRIYLGGRCEGFTDVSPNQSLFSGTKTNREWRVDTGV